MSLIWFLLAILILVPVHEFGHFIIARWCGVKVLRFSIGFGKVLGVFKDKKGTEYALSAIPLGGYVKMLDENEGHVTLNEQSQAFNRKPLWQRFLIVFAGPWFNFMFAVVCFWLIAIIGMQTLKPIIGDIKPESVAARAGFHPKEQIIAVNNKKIRSWQDFQIALMHFLGSERDIAVTVQSLHQSPELRVLNLKSLRGQVPEDDFLGSLGISPALPNSPLIINTVEPASPAKEAGLEQNDRIVALNGNRLNNWMVFAKFIEQHPATDIQLQILHNGILETKVIRTAVKLKRGKRTGFIGLRSQPTQIPPEWMSVQKENLVSGFKQAVAQTYHLTQMSFVLFGRLIIGQLDSKALSGPVQIAVSAKASADEGFVYYLSFLGLLSVSLATINLLPIPLLDGGHLFYYLIEAIRRKSLSFKAQAIGRYLGLLFIVMLMSVSLFNDLSRLLG